MKILGKGTISTLRFKDLKLGDVFYFISEKSNEDVQVYIRCGHKSNDKIAINLETGIIYCFDNNLPVCVLDCYLKIKD